MFPSLTLDYTYMIKSIKSFTDLTSTFSPASAITVTANSISHVLYTSKGREIFLALVQYSAELYKYCMKDFAAGQEEDRWIGSVQSAKSIESSMSNGRKMIRFLRFLDEVGAVERLIENTKAWSAVPALKMLSHAASFLYYVLDNFVLASSIGIISKFIATINIKWKNTKDMSSFARCVLEVIIVGLTLRETRQSIRVAEMQLRSGHQTTLTLQSKNFEILAKLLANRRRLRFMYLDLLQNCLRLLMLVKALSLPGSKHLSSIFIAGIGVTTSALSVFKILTEQPTVVKVEPPK
jgi:hypothetical protein